MLHWGWLPFRLVHGFQTLVAQKMGSLCALEAQWHRAFLAIGHSADDNPGIDAFGFGGVLSLSRRLMTQYV